MENGEQIISSDYDLLFLPYNSNYVNQVIDSRIEYYQIDFELYENGDMVSLFDTPRVIHTPESTAFLPHIVEIYNLYTGKPYGYKLSSLSHLLDIIAALAKEQDEDYEMAAARKRIRPTLEYISANYYNSCDVKELAAISGLSISGLEKNFIKATGMSPVAYRNTIRIEHAKTMLLSGFSISAVCEKVGFADLYYFAKTFKRITGITPGRFAKRERK
jgi:AraC-like DNA-binding protein